MPYRERMKKRCLTKSIAISIVIILTLSTFPSIITSANDTETIRINEIMYNPAGTDSGREWIEIYNTKEYTINISGWKFYENNINHTINLIQGSWDIPSNDFAVIVDDPVDFLIDYPSYDKTLFDSAFSLLNAGEYIALKNDLGEIVDGIFYIPQDGANDTGMSLEYKVDDIWEVSYECGGTPGSINSVSIPMKISKKVWNGEAWVSNITAMVGDILRFNITITHTGPNDCPLQNFTVKDTLPEILSYNNNATFNNNPREPDSIENQILIWNISDIEFSLLQGESAYLEFDAIGTDAGEGDNIVNVTSQYCYPELHNVYGEDNVTVILQEEENNPPYVPSNPDPFDHETDVDVNADLSWIGGDPDLGDTVTYDVYFGTSSPPPKVSENQSLTLYDPGTMNYNTTYYWQIIAWDNHDASTSGPIWEFTTTSLTNNVTVNITRPLENFFYIRDTRLLPLRNNTIVYGPINITVNASADAGIDRVEFYIDGDIKSTDETEPYCYSWAPIISFKHTIKVVAYDNNGNNASDEIEVFKWRFHPVLIMAGLALIYKLRNIDLGLLTGWTILRGYVFNFKPVGKYFVFRAVRLHYITISPFGIDSGILKQKKYMIKNIGRDIKIDLGPIGLFKWIFGVYRGPVKQWHIGP